MNQAAPSKLTRKVAALLFLYLSLLTQLAHGDQNQHPSTPTVPPEQNFKWNISSKNSFVEQVFIVTEYRTYAFCIGFGSPIAADDKTHQEWRQDKRIWAFLGHAGYIGFKNARGSFVPKMDETGILIPVMDPKGDLGVTIPVDLQIQSLDENDKPSKTIASISANTNSLMSGGYVVARLIAMIKLRPGKYIATAKALQDTDIPDGVGTYLQISYHTKSTTIVDDKK
jgi:Domain of unknown function (DUF5625)